MSTAIDRRYLRPREVAEILDVKQDTILAYIHSGLLEAVNVAHPDAKQRPRWKVSVEALDDFVSRRTYRPAPSKPQPQRRQRSVGDGPY